MKPLNPSSGRTKIRPTRSRSTGDAGLDDPRVLHVEDVRMLRLTTQRGVEANKWIYVGVSSGEEALELFKKEKFDVVLMDINIEGAMDGYETAKAILKINPQQLIFSVSGSEIKEDMQYLFKANLGKIGGKVKIRAALQESLLEKRVTFLNENST